MMAVRMRSCEEPGPSGQGSRRMRFAIASYSPNASSKRFRAADASFVGASSGLFLYISKVVKDRSRELYLLTKGLLGVLQTGVARPLFRIPITEGPN